MRTVSERLIAVTLVANVLAANLLFWQDHLPLEPDSAIPTTARSHESLPGRAGLPASQPEQTFATLFSDDVPDVRLFACESAGRSGDARWIPALLVRLADIDPPVRHASLTALARLSPAAARLPEPDANETQSLPDLVDAFQNANIGISQDISICELWADSSYTAMPASLLDTCLNCHAGWRRLPFARNQQCQTCHQAVYDEWSRSAHAQSVVHLPAAASGMPTSEPASLPPDAVHGISCIECHNIASTATTGSARTTDQNQPACPHTFATPSGEAGSCVACHADTAREWQQWLALEAKPRPALWPPGDLSWVKDDRRTCVDCHMPRLSQDDSAASHPAHSWSARRNLPLLKQSVHLAASMGKTETGFARLDLTLTNTSGHAWPAGTCRRTIELIVDLPPPASPIVIARIGQTYPTRVTTPDLQPPLAPGEQRTIRWPIPEGNERIQYRLRYIRDRLLPTRYSADILTGERHVR